MKTQIDLFEKDVVKVAQENSYESSSDFHKIIKKFTEQTVEQNKRDLSPVHLSRITTPLGPMIAGTTEDALCLLEFIDRNKLEAQLQNLQKRIPCVFVPDPTNIKHEVAEQLKKYFDGSLKQFKIKLKLTGTDFQQKVWRQLQTIPYGQTRSYKEQAQQINNEKAIRAVAGANGQNRIAIIIPCHRVIGSDGSLTGYGGGLWRKKYLLDLEQRNCNK